MNTRNKYSVIIPTFNEEDFIDRLLLDLRNQSYLLPYNIEIIIVDGKSTDRTIEICCNYNITIIDAERGRGNQLREGVKVAKGENLIFLHADLILPNRFFNYLDINFVDKIQIATFRMKFDENKLLYKIYSFFTNFDSIFSTFGDQGIIVKKIFYSKIGGFKNLPIMEDVDFFRTARKQTKIIKFNEYIISSSRRFKIVGVVKTQLKSFIFIVRYLLGSNTKTLYEQYYDKNYEHNKSSNNFHKIAGIGKSQNQIGFNNK